MTRRLRLAELPPLGPAPRVTILMPLRNEARYIEASLTDVLGQDYPMDRVEVLVCDGESDDDTVAIIERTAAAHTGADVRVLRNRGRTRQTALNLGLSEARGDLIIGIDGHCRIPRGYVRQLVELSQQTSAAVVGGRVETTGVNPVSSAIAAAQSSRFGVGGIAFRMSDEPGPVETVLFGAYRREAFELLGGYYTELLRTEDDEFHVRLRKAGGVIWMDPAIRFTHFSRPDLPALWRQYYGYGRYKPRVMQMHHIVISPRHLVPAAFVLGLAGAVATSVVTRRAAPLAAVLAPYVALTGVNAVRTARSEGVSALHVALATTVLHLSYGAGTISGLLHLRSDGHPPPPAIDMQPVDQAGGIQT
jgi:GT2 family glycosyltransferase